MTKHTTERLTAELALDARATLGECVRWDERERLIYWVDIPGQRLHRYHPAAELRYLPLTTRHNKEWVALLDADMQMVGWAQVDGF